METFYVFSKNPEQTSEVASIVAPFLRLDDTILLIGQLASGKTLFVKVLASALGSTNPVTSPTYVIAHFYKIQSGSLLHIDAYRLSDPVEFRDLGLEEFFPSSITVVEWGEIVAKAFSSYLSIGFDFMESNENHRKLTFSYVGDQWHSRMTMLNNKLIGYRK